jgi:hypothetical protein
MAHGAWLRAVRTSSTTNHACTTVQYTTDKVPSFPTFKSEKEINRGGGWQAPTWVTWADVRDTPDEEQVTVTYTVDSPQFGHP